jgi:hypothetical protein
VVVLLFSAAHHKLIFLFSCARGELISIRSSFLLIAPHAEVRGAVSPPVRYSMCSSHPSSLGGHSEEHMGSTHSKVECVASREENPKKARIDIYEDRKV